MQASPMPETFAPLPLRARGGLEIVDVALKVYRRYFGVLLGWSALVVICSFIPIVNYVAWLLTPLIIGATMCCIAAAVRGQPVHFAQCWQFTKGRFGPMLGMYVLGFIIVFAVMMAVFLLCGLLLFLGVQIFQNAPPALQITAGVVGGLALLVLATLLSAVAMIWLNMVPIVVCMEDDKHNTRALARAYDLMRGHWLRVTTVITVLSLGVLAVMGILFVTGAMLVGLSTLRDLALGQTPSGAVWGGIIGLGLLWVLLWTLWNPVFYLTLALFYLDIRVRKEALDLEWTAHATAPAVSPAEAVNYAATPAFSPIESPVMPSSAVQSPVAPPSSLTPTAAAPAASAAPAPPATPAAAISSGAPSSPPFAEPFAAPAPFAVSSDAPSAFLPVAPSAVTSETMTSGTMPPEMSAPMPPTVMQPPMPPTTETTAAATSAATAEAATAEAAVPSTSPAICPQCGAATPAPPPGFGAAGAATFCMQCGARLSPLDSLR